MSETHDLYCRCPKARTRGFYKVSKHEILLTLAFCVLLWITKPQLFANGPEGGSGWFAFGPDGNTVYMITGGNGLYKSTDGGESWGERRGPINFGGSGIIINPIDTNLMYSSTIIADPAGGDIAKSTDEGHTWRLSLASCNFPAMDPLNPNVLYATGQAVITRGIWKSTDGGENWNRIALEGQLLGRLAVHPIETNTIYVGGNPGLWKSSNGGESWTLVAFADRPVNLEAIDPIDPMTVYVRIPGEGIHKTTDGGNTWTALPTDLGMFTSVSMAIDPTDTRIIYLGVSDDAMHKSSDGGETWRLIGDFFTTSVYLNPSDARTIYVNAYIATARSTDAGETWTLGGDGIVVTRILSMALAPSDTNRIYVDSQGWSRSTDGGETWSPLRFFNNPRLYLSSLAVDPNNPETVYGGGNGIWKSTDAGESWLRVMERGDVVAVDPNSSDLVYAGATACCPLRGEVFKSTNAGEDWTRVGVLPDIIYTLVVNPLDTNIVYAGVRLRGIYKSTDGGLSWRPSGLSGLAVRSIVVDSKGILYAGADRVYKSTDGGANWEPLNSPSVISVVVDPFDLSTLYIGNLNGIYKSTDAGQTWEPRNEGLTNTRIRQLVIAPDTGRLYAGTEGGGVWFSDDQAETWE